MDFKNKINMNYRIVLIAIFFNCALASAQNVTNVEGSKYIFKEVIRHDDSPVESQGRTGTCWSFSALSFLESEIMRVNKTDKPVPTRLSRWKHSLCPAKSCLLHLCTTENIP